MVIAQLYKRVLLVITMQSVGLVDGGNSGRAAACAAGALLSCGGRQAATRDQTGQAARERMRV